jgi:hypothetical protein
VAAEKGVSCGGWLIVTKEQEALAVSLNMGYFYNDYGSAQDALLKTRGSRGLPSTGRSTASW